MPIQNEYRAAIAGIGAVAEIHAHAIRDIDGVELVAGACRTESKGREFSSMFDCSWYADTEAMLDAESPDILTVATPSGVHLEPVMAAIERDIDVLCEKPLEITTERIDRIIEAADRADVTVGGLFQQRFNPVVKTIQSAVCENRFGDLSVVNTYIPWWREDDYYESAWQGTQELDGGGALINQSIHGIDAVQWIAGTAIGTDIGENPVKEVFAYMDRRAHDADLLEVEDTAVAVLRYRDGTLGQVLGATSMYPGSLKRIQVAGRDGTAELLEDELVTWSFRDERPEDDDIRARFCEETHGGGAADPMSIDYSNHRRNIEAFVNALRTDKTYPLPASEARIAVEIIESIYESAETGQPVRIDGGA